MHSYEVSQVRFTSTKFREGYNIAQVDALVGKAQVALAQWEAGRSAELQSMQVTEARFVPTLFRQGYVQDEVDNFLDALVQTLAAYEKR